MKAAVLSTFLLFMIAGQGFAAEPAEVVLRDGSIIRAEVISLQDGLYTLKSESLGTIVIEQSRIADIRMGAVMSSGSHPGVPSSTTPKMSPQTADPNVTAQIDAMREILMSDPGAMNKLSSLTSDPELMSVVQDPEIMKLVASGDIKALMANDKFMALLDNPSIQEIIRKISP